MRVLVTGANGFVGRALGPVLLDHGYEVVGAVRRQMASTAFPVVAVGDIGPATRWREALEGVDVVIHLAARVHMMKDEAADPLQAYRQVNTLGSVRLAEQAAQAGVRRFIYVSSIKVNGEGGETISAADSADPADPYAQSKWEAEQRLGELSARTGMELVIVRPPLVYGPGVKANFLSLMRWVDRGLPLPFGAVKNKRSLVSVKNLADLLCCCVDHPNAAGEVFLVADEEDVSTPELLREVGRALGRDIWLPKVPTVLLDLLFGLLGRQEVIRRLSRSLRVDTANARDKLGWRPAQSLQEGLAQVSQWYRQEKANRHA